MAYEHAKLALAAAKVSDPPAVPQCKLAAQSAKVTMLAIDRRMEIEATFSDQLEENLPGLADATAEALAAIAELQGIELYQAALAVAE
jgi:hypothetical protein